MVNISPIICVDLDGTLISSNTTKKTALFLLKKNPFLIFSFLSWILRGFVFFQSKLIQKMQLDPGHFTYNQILLTFLYQQKEHGASIYLVTASDEKIALKISQHLHVFSGVIASQKHTLLTGFTKARLLEKNFGETPFDYIGNSILDIPSWLICRNRFFAGNNRFIYYILHHLMAVKKIELDTRR